jgi:hypothetical protein
MTALGRLNDPALAPFTYRAGILYSAKFEFKFWSHPGSEISIVWYHPCLFFVAAPDPAPGRQNYAAPGRQLCCSDSLSLGNNMFSSIEKNASVHIAFFIMVLPYSSWPSNLFIAKEKCKTQCCRAGAASFLLLQSEPHWKVSV